MHLSFPADFFAVLDGSRENAGILKRGNQDRFLTLYAAFDHIEELEGIGDKLIGKVEITVLQPLCMVLLELFSHGFLTVEEAPGHRFEFGVLVNQEVRIDRPVLVRHVLLHLVSQCANQLVCGHCIGTYVQLFLGHHGPEIADHLQHISVAAFQVFYGTHFHPPNILLASGFVQRS